MPEDQWPEFTARPLPAIRPPARRSPACCGTTSRRRSPAVGAGPELATPQLAAAIDLITDLPQPAVGNGCLADDGALRAPGESIAAPRIVPAHNSKTNFDRFGISQHDSPLIG